MIAADPVAYCCTSDDRRADNGERDRAGQGERFASPDEARCLLAVSGLHGTVAAAVEDVSARAAALSELLVELGVSSHDRLTSAVTVEEQVEHRDGVPW